MDRLALLVAVALLALPGCLAGRGDTPSGISWRIVSVAQEGTLVASLHVEPDASWAGGLHQIGSLNVAHGAVAVQDPARGEALPSSGLLTARASAGARFLVWSTGDAARDLTLLNATTLIAEGRGGEAQRIVAKGPENVTLASAPAASVFLLARNETHATIEVGLGAYACDPLPSEDASFSLRCAPDLMGRAGTLRLHDAADVLLVRVLWPPEAGSPPAPLADASPPP